MFQEVEANPASLERYIDDMVAGVPAQGRDLPARPPTSCDEPELLAPFDRIVVATGASYPYGLGPWAMALLDLGAGGWPGIVAAHVGAEAARLVLLPRAERHRATASRGWRAPGQIVTVIGDAAKPGKSKEAIASAFEAALLGK